MRNKFVGQLSIVKLALVLATVLSLSSSMVAYADAWEAYWWSQDYPESGPYVPVPQNSCKTVSVWYQNLGTQAWTPSVVKLKVKYDPNGFAGGAGTIINGMVNSSVSNGGLAEFRVNLCGNGKTATNYAHAVDLGLWNYNIGAYIPDYNKGDASKYSNVWWNIQVVSQPTPTKTPTPLPGATATKTPTPVPSGTGSVDFYISQIEVTNMNTGQLLQPNDIVPDGIKVRVKVWITNGGNGDSSGIRLEYYDNSTYMDYDNTFPFTGSETEDENETFYINGTGVHTLKVVLDPANQFKETNEFNNIATFTLNVGNPTPTNTSTNTPTNTSTPTPTNTATNTPTNTSTPTNTPTNTPIPAPVAPSNVSATTGGSGVNVRWYDNSTVETGFKIERSANGVDGWLEIKDAPLSSVFNNLAPSAMSWLSIYDTTTYPCGTTNYYRVRAYNTSGYSAYSNVASVTTTACTPTPLPTNTPTPTPTFTKTPTSTPTNTPVPPTNTPTFTPVPPTNTPTFTPVPPTKTPTFTPVPPTNTPTFTPIPPTNTSTFTPVPPTKTAIPATNTPLPTSTNTPVPPTKTAIPATNTPLPTSTNTPLPTSTNTPLPTSTNTPVATNTPMPATNTPMPTLTLVPQPQLSISNSTAQANSSSTVVISFNGASNITALTSHIKFDPTCLKFNTTDANGDGLADAITSQLPAAFGVSVIPQNGGLDMVISDSTLPFSILPNNVLLTLRFETICSPVSTLVVPITLENTSFGNTIGQSVNGTTINGSMTIMPVVVPTVVSTPTPVPTSIATAIPTATPLPTSAAVTLGMSAPITVIQGQSLTITITLAGILKSDDLQAMLFTLKDGAGILSPICDRVPDTDQPNNIIPAPSMTQHVCQPPLSGYIITVPPDSVQQFDHDGVIVGLPYKAVKVGCTTVSFDQYQLANSQMGFISRPIVTQTATICVKEPLGQLQGQVTPQYRVTDKRAGITVNLLNAQGTVAQTVTDANGNYNFANLVPGSYTLRFKFAKFVMRETTITINAGETTTTNVGMWAGDIDGSSNVPNNPTVNTVDWYICSAALLPVNNKAVCDINGDDVADVRDLWLVNQNMGRPNMRETDPIATTNRQATRVETVSTQAQLHLLPQGNDSLLLQITGIQTEAVVAVGSRLTLPVGATVTQVVAQGEFETGFLNWSQENEFLYLTLATPLGQSLKKDKVILKIDLSSGDSHQVAIESSNIVAVPASTFRLYLPFVVK